MDISASYEVLEGKWINHPPANLLLNYLFPSRAEGELSDCLKCHQLEKGAKMPHQPLNVHQRGTNYIYRDGEWGLMFKHVMLN